MSCHGLTDAGRRRDANQDQFLIADLNKSMRIHQTSLGLDHQTRLFGGSQGKLLLVADGMGGHAAGERASTLAVDSVASYVLNTMRWLFRLDDKCEDDFLDDLQAAMEHCQEIIRAEARQIPKRHGMGTTLTMSYIVWPQMYSVHVGDSRCYLFRDGRLTRLTHDHTVAEKMVEAGNLSEDEPAYAKLKKVLWNSLGDTRSDKLWSEVSKTELRIGDAVLLCTDGLNEHVSDDEIAAELGRGRSADEACRRLVDAANAGGGSDNITVVIARFEEQQPSDAMAEEAGRDSQKSLASADTDPFLVADGGEPG